MFSMLLACVVGLIVVCKSVSCWILLDGFFSLIFLLGYIFYANSDFLLLVWCEGYRIIGNKMFFFAEVFHNICL